MNGEIRTFLPGNVTSIPWGEASEAFEIRKWLFPRPSADRILLFFDIGNNGDETIHLLARTTRNEPIARIKLPQAYIDSVGYYNLVAMIRATTSLGDQINIGDEKKQTKARIERKGKNYSFCVELKKDDGTPYQIEFNITQGAASRLGSFCHDRKIWQITHKIPLTTAAGKKLRGDDGEQVIAEVNVLLKDTRRNRRRMKNRFPPKAAGILVRIAEARNIPLDNIQGLSWLEMEARHADYQDEYRLARMLTVGQKSKIEAFFPPQIVSKLPINATMPRNLQFIL